MAKILALSASNSKNSINKTLLNVAIGKIKGHDIKSIDITDYPMPFFSLDVEKSDGAPKSAKKVRAMLSEHDAVIVSCPEHNGLPPAEFKNLIDWVSRVEQGPMFGETKSGDKKPVLLLSASPGPNGGATNLATLTQLMPWWGADIKGSYSLGSFYDNCTEGKLNTIEDEKLAKIINQFTEFL